ncbi:MAG: M48 family metalloprotease [Pseudomonadota bacterium]
MADTAPGRRGFLRSFCGHCMGLAGLAYGLDAVAQAAAPVAPVTGRFLRPGIETEEGGLWGMMDREETRLRRSPFAIRDAELNRYVQDIVCRLGGDHCPDVRVYLVRTPMINATMAPNGMMQVWSGLLLRVENEAQLAAVLGHEIGHYMERHTLERLRDIKSRSAAAQIMGMFGAIGALGQLGVMAGAFSFSREQESSADRIGVGLMQKAGYEGRQAALVWDNLLGELKIKGGENAGTRNPMMASHPPAETRRDDLLKISGTTSGNLGLDEFRKATAAHRLGWLQDEVKRGQYEESLVLFDRLIKQSPSDAQLLYARGEVYRQRATQADETLALADLDAAAGLQNPPPEAFRALGLLQKKRQSAGPAVESFEKYLAAAPTAPDAELIKTYVSELKP